MEFNENKSIYLQIADITCEQILLGKIQIGERVPSIREIGISLQVNPNTVLKSYEYLELKKIIFTKRGLGYFVVDDAIEKILEFRREEFFEYTLPEFFKTMTLLKIPKEEIIERYKKYIETSK
jgi:DNA-binding transcriptional regulator YhcF (GntR family)